MRCLLTCLPMWAMVGRPHCINGKWILSFYLGSRLILGCLRIAFAPKSWRSRSVLIRRIRRCVRIGIDFAGTDIALQVSVRFILYLVLGSGITAFL